MIQAKCIQKFRDSKNKIYGYRLIDINNQTQDVTPDDLKRAILNRQINIVNLTLTSDGRLIDKAPERQLANKKIMPNKVEKPVNKIENMANTLANKVYKKLGINQPAKEITCLNNNYDGNIDQRYEPELNYKGNKVILAITIYPKEDEIWLSLEDIDENEPCLEMKASLSEIDKLIDKFTDKILGKGSKQKRPYDSESYTEFIKSLTSLMEKTFGFNNDKEKLNFGSFNIDPDTKDITWLSGVMGDFIYDGNKCYIEIDYTYNVDSKDGVILFDVMVQDGDGSPQYTFKYEFDSLNMKAHFSKILKETQQFIYHVKNNWKH